METKHFRLLQLASISNFRYINIVRSGVELKPQNHSEVTAIKEKVKKFEVKLSGRKSKCSQVG